MVKDIIVGTRKFFEKPVDESSGITAITSGRFWVCLLLSAVATCALARDPLFCSARMGFRYGCGILSPMLSYVTLSALFWDLMLFGRPRRANLLLQLITFIPFTLFTARTFLQPVADESPTTLVGSVWSAIQHIDKLYLGVSDVVGRIVPSWTVDVFSHWQVAVVLLFVVMALCLKNGYEKWKVGFLFCAFLLGFAGALAVSVSWQFILGTVLLSIALALMYHPCDEQVFYDNWIGEMGKEPVHAVLLDLVACVMGEAYKRGRLSEVEYITLVESRLAREGNVPEETAGKIRESLRRFLLTEKRFIRLTWTSDGTYLTVHPRLLQFSVGYAFALAACPRMFIVALLGFAWAVSPLDIIPDALPFIGVLDDVAVGILSMKSIGETGAAMIGCKKKVHNPSES